jgi:hypothetical protein
MSCNKSFKDNLLIYSMLDIQKKNIVYINMNLNNSYNNMNIPLPSTSAMNDLRRNRLNLNINKLFTNKIKEFDYNIKSDSDIVDLVGKLRSSPFPLLLMSGNVGFTANQTTLNNLVNNLDNLLIDNKSDGSDGAFVQSVKNDGKINISKIINQYLFIDDEVSQGAFFKYYSLINYDLSEFGIFHRGDDIKDITENSCFIQSLISYGLDEHIINKAKEFIQTRNLPRNKINEICKKLNIHVSIKDINTKKKLYHKGDKSLPEIQIGQIDNHYFHRKDVDITSYAIKNYHNIKHLDNWNHIYKKENNKYKYSKTRKIDSYKLIKLLLENKDILLEKIDLDNEIYKSQYHDMFNINDIKSLEYNKENLGINQFKQKKDKSEFVNLYFDFETITSGDIHREISCSVTDENEITKSFKGKKCGNQLLNYCVKFYGMNIRLIAHNVNYDYRFIYKYLCCINELSPNNRLMTAEAKFYYFGKYANILIKDSYSLISTSLKKFSDMFNIDVKKEILPYRLYNDHNVKIGFIDKDICIEEVKYQYECNNIGEDYNSKLSKKNKEKFVNEFLNNCNEWNCIKDNKIDIMKYCIKYCDMDCIVLKKGYSTFREWLIKSTGLDINDYPSLASISDAYLKKENCYDGVKQLSGIPRSFIQETLVGGRTMLSENLIQVIKGIKIADFDKNSLYPSAMYLMKGFLKGNPKVIINFEPEKYDGYFILIKINKVNIKRKFPILNYKNNEGVRIFSNDMVGKSIYVDKTTLEDLIEFHKIEYEFIKGYYYDEGFNTKIKEVIKDLFDTRVKYKKEGNPIQEIYKLLMNSSYGKSALKPVNTESKYITKKQYSKTIIRYYNFIKEIIKINDDMYKFTFYKSLDEHFNNVHIGSSILSYSKRLMNRVMCLAEDNNLDMYYTDTDSIHMNYDHVDILGKLYKEKYNTELIGKNMGQMHVDFTDKLKGIKCRDVHSDYLIALGKKIYIDRLVGYDIKNNKKIIDYHIRLKGISNQSILYTARKFYKGSVIKLYEDLLKGKTIEFDLLCGGMKCSFEMNNNLTISSRQKFNREILIKS